MKTVAGFGPAFVDYIHIIDKYPERGGHTVVKKTAKSPGGAAANVIYALALYGMKCYFYSPIGDDEDGELFIESFKMAGVDTSRIHVIPENTGKVECYVDSDGERTFFVHPNASCRLKYIKIGKNELSDFDLIYFDPYPCAESFKFHLKIAAEASIEGVTVALNPGYPYTKTGFEKLKQLLELSNIVIMNRDELRSLGVRPEDILSTGTEIVVITLGEDGSIAYTPEGAVRADSFKTKVVDTTGAGDGFSAGFLYGYLNGFDLEKCLMIGNWVASKNISRVGARNFPSLNELRKFLEDIL